MVATIARISLLLGLCCYFLMSPPPLALAIPGGPHCNRLDFARDLMKGKLDDAYSLSVGCEQEVSSQLKTESFAEDFLRMQYFVTAELLAAQGKIKESQGRIEKTAKMSRSDLLLWEDFEIGAKGFLLEKSGRLNEAIQFYKANSSQVSNERLAIIYLDQEKTTEANEIASALLKSQPENPTARIVFAGLMDKRDNKEALRQYKQALEVTEQYLQNGRVSGNPLYYIELGRATARLKD